MPETPTLAGNWIVKPAFAPGVTFVTSGAERKLVSPELPPGDATIDGQLHKRNIALVLHLNHGVPFAVKLRARQGRDLDARHDPHPCIGKVRGRRAAEQHCLLVEDIVSKRGFALVRVGLAAASVALQFPPSHSHVSFAGVGASKKERPLTNGIVCHRMIEARRGA